MSDVAKVYAYQALFARRAAEASTRRARALKAEMLRYESEAACFEQEAQRYAAMAKEAKGKR